MTTREEHKERSIEATRRQKRLEYRQGWGLRSNPAGRAWWKMEWLANYHWHHAKHGGMGLRKGCKFCDGTTTPRPR